MLALWFEVQTVLDELGHGKHLRRVASMPKRRIKHLSSKLRERTTTSRRRG